MRVLLALVAALALLAPASSAAAKPKPITGSVARGYTVIALAKSGRTSAAVSKPRFKLVPPARKVSLHLRNSKGAYAGPVVLAAVKKKAVMGAKAGATLGKLRVKRGYAVPARKPRAAALDLKWKALAKRGVPIGAGKLGLVAAPLTGRAGRGRDHDRDGIPGVFDVDDDGDRVLDNVDRKAGTARAAFHDPAGQRFHPFWVINAGLEVSYISDDRGLTQGAAGYALNQNAAGPFAADADFKTLRDLVMKDRGELFFPIDPADASKLDCRGLAYCDLGGGGFFHNRMQKFPEQFGATEKEPFGAMPAVPGFQEGQNGLGTMQSVDPKTVFGLAPLAGAPDIESGHAFVQRFASGKEESLLLNTVFETLPALQGWSDGTASGTVAYPVPRGGVGSEGNAIELNPSASGDYVLTLTVWRPQRRPIKGSREPAGWLDIGGLTYTVVGKTVEQNRRVWHCPANAYSAAGSEVSVGDGGIVDSAPARPVNAANTLTFSVNLSECMRASGLPALAPGEVPSDVFVTASSEYGDAAEGVGFAFKPKTAGPSSSQFTGTWKFVGGAPGNELEWTISANGAETSHFGIITYSPYTITGGTSPAGWTCQVGQAGPNTDWDCSGSTLHSSETVTGRVTLNQPGVDNMAVEMLICDASNVCKGIGMTQQP